MTGCGAAILRRAIEICTAEARRRGEREFLPQIGTMKKGEANLAPPFSLAFI